MTSKMLAGGNAAAGGAVVEREGGDADDSAEEEEEAAVAVEEADAAEEESCVFLCSHCRAVRSGREGTGRGRVFTTSLDDVMVSRDDVAVLVSVSCVLVYHMSSQLPVAPYVATAAFSTSSSSAVQGAIDSVCGSERKEHITSVKRKRRERSFVFLCLSRFSFLLSTSRSYYSFFLLPLGFFAGRATTVFSSAAAAAAAA